MTRLARQAAHVVGEATVRICGKVVGLYLAKQVYRCEECLGPLKYRNAGLICATNPAHRGFIHQKDAAVLAKYDQEKVAQVEAAYQIIDGKLVPKGEVI